MELASGAIRLANNQLSDSGSGSFINKAGTLITLGNVQNTLVLDSLLPVNIPNTGGIMLKQTMVNADKDRCVHTQQSQK